MVGGWLVSWVFLFLFQYMWVLELSGLGRGWLGFTIVLSGLFFLFFYFFLNFVYTCSRT